MNAFLVNTNSADWLFDSEYYSFLHAGILNATRKIYIQQFVIDSRPNEDNEGQVRDLLYALSNAALRGLDVRVLLAQIYVGKPYPVDINEPSARFLIKRKVKVRGYPGDVDEQLHTKLIIIDDEILITGSHNWTPNAFNKNLETSLVINSKDSSAFASGSFIKLWSKALDYE